MPKTPRPTHRHMPRLLFQGEDLVLTASDPESSSCAQLRVCALFNVYLFVRQVVCEKLEEILSAPGRDTEPPPPPHQTALVPKPIVVHRRNASTATSPPSPRPETDVLLDVGRRMVATYFCRAYFSPRFFFPFSSEHRPQPASWTEQNGTSAAERASCDPGVLRSRSAKSFKSSSLPQFS